MSILPWDPMTSAAHFRTDSSEARSSSLHSTVPVCRSVLSSSSISDTAFLALFWNKVCTYCVPGDPSIPRYLELHIQVGRTGGQICSLISELLFLLERSWGSHQIQILHRVCLKNFCFFPPSRAPFDVIEIRKETEVLQTNPIQNLNLV